MSWCAAAVFITILYVCCILASLFVSSCLGVLLLLVTGADTGTIVTVGMAILSVCSFVFDFVSLKRLSLVVVSLVESPFAPPQYHACKLQTLQVLVWHCTSLLCLQAVGGLNDH